MLFTGRNKAQVKQTSVKHSEPVNENKVSFSTRPNSRVNTYTSEKMVSKSRFTQPTNMQMMENNSDNVRRIVTTSKHNIGMESTIQSTIRDEFQKTISDIEKSHRDIIQKLENKIEVITQDNQQYRKQYLQKSEELEKKISQNSSIQEPNLDVVAKTAVEKIVQDQIKTQQFVSKHELEKNNERIISQQEYSTRVNEELHKRMDDFMKGGSLKSDEEKKKIQEFIEKIIQSQVQDIKNSNTQQHDIEHLVKQWVVKMQPVSMNEEVIERIVNQNLQIYNENIKAQHNLVATKEELKIELDRMASKTDLENQSKRMNEMASKTDLENQSKRMNEMASKTDLENQSKRMNEMASKTDLENQSKRMNEMASKTDLENQSKRMNEMASKTDLENQSKRMNEMASKTDLENQSKRINEMASKTDLENQSKRMNEMASKTDLETQTRNTSIESNLATKADLEACTKNMANMATKYDLEACAKNMANMATKYELEAYAKNMTNMATKNDLEAYSKNMATKTDLENQKTDILKLVDEKIRVLDMKELTERYLTEIISHGEDNDQTHHDEPHTKFEEIIEPAVARIIFRVLKYDRPQDHHDIDTPTTSNDAHVDFGDVYETNHSPLVDNPIYDTPIAPDEKIEETILDLGSVYKDTGTTMFKNELRDLKENKWKKIGNKGIDKGNIIDIFMDKKNKKIYIAGHFKHVNSVPTDNIAVYDMKSKAWKHVGEGIPQIASSLAVDEENEHVYVGGIFTKVGKGENEIHANNVAVYNVNENKWYPLGDGLDRECNTIVFDSVEKKLYACGSFIKSGNKDVRYVGVYDVNTKSWAPLEGGSVNATCRILMKSKNSSELYLGGLFTGANNDTVTLSYIARYNLKTKIWDNLSGGLQGYCNTMAIDEEHNMLYVGGTFNNVGENETNLEVHHIASYDLNTNKWGPMSGGVNNVVQSIYFDANTQSLFVGGTFTNTYEFDKTLNYIARFDLKTSQWHSLENYHSEAKNKEEIDDSTIGLDGTCKVVSMDNKSLIIAGKFENAGNISVNSIARYALERS